MLTANTGGAVCRQKELLHYRFAGQALTAALTRDTVPHALGRERRATPIPYISLVECSFETPADVPF